MQVTLSDFEWRQVESDRELLEKVQAQRSRYRYALVEVASIVGVGIGVLTDEDLQKLLEAIKAEVELGVNLRKHFEKDRAGLIHKHPPHRYMAYQAHAGCGHYERETLDEVLKAAADPDCWPDPDDNAEYYPRPDASNG